MIYVCLSKLPRANQPLQEALPHHKVSYAGRNLVFPLLGAYFL